MRRLLHSLALVALTTIPAAAQNNAGSTATDGSTNNAVNPKGNATSAVNASGTVNVISPSALQQGANSFTEGQARSRIEGAGFTGVTDLKKDAHGIWRGRATRNGQTVDVGFDYKGSIGAQ